MKAKRTRQVAKVVGAELARGVRPKMVSQNRGAVSEVVRGNREMIIGEFEKVGLTRGAVAMRVKETMDAREDPNSWDATKTALKIYGAFEEGERGGEGDIVINIGGL